MHRTCKLLPVRTCSVSRVVDLIEGGDVSQLQKCHCTEWSRDHNVYVHDTCALNSKYQDIDSVIKSLLICFHILSPINSRWRRNDKISCM